MASKYIQYKKLKELQAAAKGGNEQAKNIIDKYMDKNPDMDSIERLIDDYYKGIALPPVTEQPIVAPEQSENVLEEQTPTVENLDANEPVAHPEEEELEQFVEETQDGAPTDIPEAFEEPKPVDISADLDRELDGLIDNNEFDDESFGDFLSNKKRDANRARKNAEYFKAFDADGRANYLATKKDEYGHSFDNRRRKIERSLNDMNKSIDLYGNFVTDMPDDESEIDMSIVGKAYDEFTDDESAMGAFGRSWDDADNEQIKQVIQGLVMKYGKKNVMAVLNTLRQDGEAWSQFSNGKIDNAINNYGKSLDGLLK